MGCIDPSLSSLDVCNTDCVPENVGYITCYEYQEYFLYQPVTPFEYKETSDLAVSVSILNIINQIMIRCFQFHKNAKFIELM